MVDVVFLIDFEGDGDDIDVGCTYDGGSSICFIDSEDLIFFDKFFDEVVGSIF